MQTTRKRSKIIQLMIVLISFVFFISDVCAELKLESVSPKIGVLGEPLDDVTLTGTGFDGNTRVSMALDSGNKKAIVGGVATGDSARGIAISGSTAYVADGERGLIVIDISTPENPRVIGSLDTPGFAYSLALVGSTAYVADGESGLQVVDVSTPSNPRKMGDENTPGEAIDVSVSGNNAYVADHSGGLRVINITNPSKPTEIGSMETRDDAYGITVVNNRAYVTYHPESPIKFEGGLQVINISNPSKPREIGFVSIMGKALGVTVAGDYAYVANEREGFKVIDISTPTAPREVGSTPTSNRAYDVTVVDTTAYVADFLGGLFVIDISTPSNPQAIGSVDTPGFAYSLALVGNYAYVAAGESGLQVIDITVPKLQQVIGWVDTPGRAEGFTIVDDIVYLADSNGGLQVIDISDPAAPQLVNTVDTPGNARGVAVAGNYVYVADSSKGLQILDITTPTDPQVIGSEDTPGTAYNLTVVGSTAYVADRESGLQVIDVRTPSSPQIIGTVNTPGQAVAVTVSGNIAYVADRTGGLHVIDIDPSHTNPPTYLTIIETVEPFSEGCNEGRIDQVGPNYFAVDETRQLGYLAHGFCGLYVFDISNPSNLQLLGLVHTPNNPRHVTVEGDTAYLADADSGLQVIDISTPSNPLIISSVDTAGVAVWALIEDDKAYVADYRNGFLVVPLPVEVTPTVNSPTEMSATLPSPSLAGDYILRVFNQTESDELPGAVTFILPEDAPRIFGSKAIIMAGDGPPLTLSFRNIAEAAYDALIGRGYLPEDIYYLTPDSANIKRNADATSANLSYAINTWAKEQDVYELSELLLFITGHGLPGEFNPKSTDSLQVSDLKSWLDDLQNDTDARVIFIYDACNSGSFLIEMAPPAGKERISITSSTSIQTATIDRNGLDSFSYNFWFEIETGNGAKLAKAFNFGKNSMEPGQTALLDADGNENPNEETDIISDVVILRTDYTPGLKKPTIDQVSPEQSLQGETTATFWAKGITGLSDDISKLKVYARIITPPPCDPEPTLPTATATSDIPTVELLDPDQDGKYEGSYNFSAAGAYRVVIFAQDENEDGLELESYSKDAFVYQSYGPDCYENDDKYEDAKNITIDDGTPQPHNFYNIGDEDWVKFYGIAGTRYIIEASNLFPHADVVLEIYADTDPTTPLEPPQNSIGDPNANETLRWTCPQTGVFYVKVKPFSSEYTGEGSDYDLRVYEPIASIPGRIRGNITDLRGSPIAEAEVTTAKKGAFVRSSGSYQMFHPAGKFMVTAKASGYTEKSLRDVIVERAGETTIDFALAPIDTDGDGILDAIENSIPCLNANDDDTDDDGILDGQEDARNTDPCDADTDNDGLLDGTEIGLAAPQGSNTNLGVFIPDNDPASTTDPLDEDSDNDGRLDGEEDANHNGRVDQGETNPNQVDKRAMPWIFLLLDDE